MISNDDNLLLLTLLRDKYALISTSVIQILQTLTITPVSTSVRYFVGSTTFRGEVVPVIDLQSFFYGGSLIIKGKDTNIQNNYIVLDHAGKKVIFQVESVLGSIKPPEESLITDLVKFANPSENPYFDKAFIDDDEQIIVKLDNEEIIDRIIYELEQAQSEFIAENQEILEPIEVPEDLDFYNIDLHQKLSLSAPKVLDSGFQKDRVSIQETVNTATLVIVRNLNILIPNNCIVEIFNVTKITKVPNSPKAFVGVINFRGDVINALDLSELLFPTSEEGVKGRKIENNEIEVLILESIDQRMAIFVDEIQEIVNIDKSDLKNIIKPNDDINSNYYFSGVTLDHKGQIILVLDIEYLFQVFTNSIILERNSNQAILFEGSKEDVISQTELSQKATLSKKNLVLITLLGAKYALVSSSVVQLIQTLIITPVSTSVRYFIGSTTFRGEVVPVIDLESFFYGGSLVNVSKKSIEHTYYIALDHAGKTVIFQVESVLGSIESPEESSITDLIQFSNPHENPYFKKAFIDDNEQIIVQLDNEEIINRIIYELEQSQKEFIAETQAILRPIEIPKDSEVYNIDLHQKLSLRIPTRNITSDRAIQSSHKITRTATLVSIKDFEILIPNDFIVEIFSISTITEAPNAPDTVIGAVNFRGDVLTALNLEKVLLPDNLTTKKNIKSLTSEIDVLIVEVPGQRMAIFVDRIIDIMEMEEEDIRPIIVSNTELSSRYYFEGLILDRFGQILPVLDVAFIFQISINPEILKQDDTQIIFIENPVEDSKHKSIESKQEGLLFEDEGYFFFLDSDFVIQVIEYNSFLLKDYSHKAIKGATVHNNIVPLIDFSKILNGNQTRSVQSENTAGILVCHSKSNLEVTFLVDKVIDRIPVNKLEVFKEKLELSSEIIPPIISGFFSYQESLGIILNADHLITEAQTILQRNLKLKNIKEEFSSTLSSKELENLGAIKARREELELLLFYQQKKTRLDYFVFSWRDILLSIDVMNTRRVFSSLQWKQVDSKFHPIIGIATVDGAKIPVIDLETSVLNSEKLEIIEQYNYFFSLEYENQAYLVPVNNVEGVVTTFKEDLVPCKDDSFFSKRKKICLNTFSIKKGSVLVYIIEMSFLDNVISSIDVDMFLNNYNMK